MTRSLRLALALAAASWCGAAAGQDREVVLNYSDPEGAELAMAMVLHADELPAWTRTDGRRAMRDGRAAPVVVRRPAAAMPQYTMTLHRAAAGAGINRAATPSAVIGNRLALRGAPKLSAATPPCGDRPGGAAACRLSDTAASVAALLGRGAPNGSVALQDLIQREGLVLESRSVRKVVAALDASGEVDHVDFIGVLGRSGGSLAAPDATPADVLRVNRDGAYEIVRRRQEDRVDLRDVKFGFEGAK